MKNEINIIGNGYMGSQVSALFHLMGYKVNIFYNVNKNENLIINNIRLLKKKILFTEKTQNFHFFNDLDNIKKFPTIECASENLLIKKKIFKKIFKKFDVNIFSNTSSINVNEINAKINVLHFFNPIFIGIFEVFKTKNIDYAGEQILNYLNQKNFLVLNIPSPEKVILNKIIFSEISNFFYLIEKENVNKNELFNTFNKMKNYNLLSLLDIIGIDTSVAILKNLKKLNNKFYIPQILEEALLKKILGKKNKKSISIIFNSEDYPNLI
jgi:3-hydroxyacyl-CoA dehydrogenase